MACKTKLHSFHSFLVTIEGVKKCRKNKSNALQDNALTLDSIGEALAFKQVFERIISEAPW